VTYSLSTLETIVADIGDNLSPKSATICRRNRRSATVAVFGDSCRIRRQSPFLVTVSEFGGCPGKRHCRRIRVLDDSRRWRKREQWRAMEYCSTDERLRQETLCRRQWTDEYVERPETLMRQNVVVVRLLASVSAGRVQHSHCFSRTTSCTTSGTANWTNPQHLNTKPFTSYVLITSYCCAISCFSISSEPAN